MTLQSLMHVEANGDGVVSRRTFLRDVSVAGAAGALTLGWEDNLMLNAQELRRQGRACILLFMRGGPSQFETFDPEPGHTNGGPTEAINTATEGIRIAAGWENTARAMNDIALVRSVSNREGEHQRATYLMHTGYAPGGGVRYPTLGSLVSNRIAPRDFDLPAFVSIGGRGGSIGSGFLGAAWQSFVVNDPNRMPSNSELPGGVNNDRFGRRLDLMRDLEEDFAEAGGRTNVEQHRAVTNSAARLIRSPRLTAFDLSQERDALRQRYGRNQFGQSCLLARRLVEAGVTFVQVDLNGWDTHDSNFTRTRALAGTCDPAFGTLVSDLRERGMLERTLVIWMGEFGRTPRINTRSTEGGRDHFPRAFSVALAGAGIRGGRVIGSTSASGSDITNRPTSVQDLFCTFCHALTVNPRQENMTPIGRPIRIVDGGQHIRELFA